MLVFSLTALYVYSNFDRNLAHPLLYHSMSLIENGADSEMRIIVSKISAIFKVSNNTVNNFWMTYMYCDSGGISAIFLIITLE